MSGFPVRRRYGEGEPLYVSVYAPGVSAGELVDDPGDRYGCFSGEGSEAMDVSELREGLFCA